MRRITLTMQNFRSWAGILVLMITLSGFGACQGQGVGVYSRLGLSPNGEHLIYVFADRSVGAANENDNVYWLQPSVGSANVVRLSTTGEILVGYVTCISWERGLRAWAGIEAYSETEVYQIDPLTQQSVHFMNLVGHSLRGCSFDPRTPNLLYFASEPTIDMAAKSDLYTLDVNTLTVTRLTDTPDEAETAPTWSQDGTFLVYGVYGGVNIQDREGNIRFVSGVNGDAFRYALSPDGKWFLSIGGYRAPGLFLVSAADGASRRVSFEAYGYVAWGGDRVALITVGVPGRNELVIKTVEELGIPEHIKAIEKDR